ncbi:MAG TPA: hypothetical protein VGL09_17305 [Methylomirabilota bacterium]
MRTRGRRSLTVVILVSFTMLPGHAGAQDADTLRRELERLREQFATITQSYEQRLKELAERLQQLESRGAPPPPAATPPTSAAQAPAAPPAPAQGPTLVDLARPRQPFALSAPGHGLLFDMGVSGDFVADFTSSTRERLHDGTFAGRENRLFPREVSVGFFGRVDPYASAVVQISAGEESSDGAPSSRELSVRLDEANLTLLTLPLGTTARIGLMRPRFGTLNTVHQDDLPQVDRPNVLARFLGEEGLAAESGVEAFWVLPASMYHEISLGVFNGDNEVAFGRGSLRDPLVIGRWRTFFEFEERGGLQIDVSAATGTTADDHRNTVVGLGAKYKWIGTETGFPVVTVAAEALGSFRTVEATEGWAGDRHLDRWGAYAYAQYDFTRRWAAGLRGDWTELPVERGSEWAISPYAQFKPSEFLRFRLQYKHTEGRGAVERVANELFLQGSFILGAHPTERF